MKVLLLVLVGLFGLAPAAYPAVGQKADTPRIDDLVRDGRLHPIVRGSGPAPLICEDALGAEPRHASRTRNRSSESDSGESNYRTDFRDPESGITDPDVDYVK